MAKIGFWNDDSGACRKVEIIDETISGKYVVKSSFMSGLMLIDKSEVYDIKETK